MLYDLEIIEEEVFIKWKEDLNDEYPGKGKALFQVILPPFYLFFFLSNHSTCFRSING